MEIKPKLSELFEQAWSAEQAYAASLSRAEQEASGALDKWAPKENLAHIGVWQQRLVDNIQAALHGGEPKKYDNYLEINDLDFEIDRLLSWEACLEKATAGRKVLLELFESFSEADLARTDVLPWQEERPLWRMFVSHLVDHPVNHLCMLYNARQQPEIQLALQEQIGRGLVELDSDPVWQGTVRYNLACVNALSGRSESALALLKEAMELHPGLVEWSKQDSDLDSLRGLPEYQALVSDQ